MQSRLERAESDILLANFVIDEAIRSFLSLKGIDQTIALEKALGYFAKAFKMVHDLYPQTKYVLFWMDGVAYYFEDSGELYKGLPPVTEKTYVKKAGFS